MSSPSSAAEQFYLTVVSPAGERRRVRVDRSPFRVGRLPDRELCLPDARISRYHAQILLEDGRYVIEDAESRHGTWVNGRRIDRANLRPNDRIEFGVPESFTLYVGESDSLGAPLLRRVAELPALGKTGNLSRLSAVLDVARALESSATLDDVLAAAVQAALTVTGAERGFLMLKTGEGELEVRAARDQAGQAVSPDEMRAPRQVLAEALYRRRDLFSMSFDPTRDTSMGFDPSQTIVALELRSVVCVPIVRIRLGQQAETRVLNPAEETLGLLYMDTREASADLVEGNKELLQTLAIEISTVLENARLLEEERQKHFLEQELHIARDIQQALLPPQLPSEGWLVAAGSSEACFQVGGDYFDVVEVSPDLWGAVVADVSGKGVSAALLTSLLQGAFFAAAATRSGLSESVGRINRYICERSRHARFSTVFCSSVHRDGRCRWVNAGHCTAVLARAKGKLELLNPTGYPIGLFPDAEFQDEEFHFEPGDKLAVYSDGVSEAANFAGERYGDDRLQRFIASRADASAAELHRAVLDDVAAFTQGADQNDDLTLLILEYQG